MTEQDKGGFMRFITSAKGAVLTIGALASAIGAVLALRPKHEHTTLKASFGNVTAYPNVDLEEYETRYGSKALALVPATPRSTHVLAVSYRLMANLSSTSTTESTSTSETTSTETESSTPQGTTPPHTPSTPSNNTEPPSGSTSSGTHGGVGANDHGSTSTFAKPPAPSAPLHEVDGVPVRDGSGLAPEQAHSTAESLAHVELPAGESSSEPTGASTTVALPKACRTSSCALTPMIDQALTDDPNPVKAARAVAAAFADSRGRVINHKLHPVGVAVNYKVELDGFAHHEAILEWSLWSQKAGRPLPRSWLRNVIAQEIEPHGDEESFSGQFWIPAPRSHSNYTVHLTLFDSHGVAHDEAETAPPFH